MMVLSLIMAFAATSVMTSCRHRRRDQASTEETGEKKKAKELKPYFYLERSGSMIAYDAEKGDGSFKASIVSMINHLPLMGQSSDAIYIVNDGVYPYPKGAKQFIADNNIFASTKEIGDASFTDFRKIFQTLSDKTNDGTVNVLVSDLIYSVKSNTENNPQKIFSSAQGMVASVFSNANDQALIVVQMHGSYNGMYYPYNTPSTGKNYDGSRPYYIVVMTTNQGLSNMLGNEAYQDFLNFSRMNGYQHIALFTKGKGLTPYYSFLLNGKENKGRISAKRGQSDQITSVDNVTADRKSGKVVMTMAVNLKGLPIEESYLTDKSNYQIDGDCDLKLKAIRKISEADRTPANRRHLGNATHIFVLKGNRIAGKNECSILLKKRIPAWIAMSSSDDDTDITSPKFAQTTFGLKYLLDGIWESFDSSAYFSMPFVIED